jgi:hypothetical protein
MISQAFVPFIFTAEERWSRSPVYCHYFKFLSVYAHQIDWAKHGRSATPHQPDRDQCYV